MMSKLDKQTKTIPVFYFHQKRYQQRHLNPSPRCERCRLLSDGVMPGILSVRNNLELTTSLEER